MTLEIRLLGGFEVHREGMPVRGFESRRVRALLAYLATQAERSFSREHLRDLFWPQAEEVRARSNLRQALYNLRSALGSKEDSHSPLLIDHRSVRFVLSEETWVDVCSFSSAVAALRAAPGRVRGGDVQELARAVQLYRGDFLDAFSLPDSPTFDDWLRLEQERLRETALGALRALVGEHLRRGHHDLGIQYASRLLRIDPTSEEASRQLMQLYTLSGQRNRALTVYENLVLLLDRELAVEPMAETSRLYQQILAEEMPLCADTSRTHPGAPLIPLVGRQEAVRQLTGQWRSVLQGRGRLTLVVGAEGLGRTRLIRTFLAGITAREQAVVLLGQGGERPHQPLVEALDDALTGGGVEVIERLSKRPATSEDPSLAVLCPLLPHLARCVPDLPRPAPGRGPGGEPPLSDLAAAAGHFLSLLSAPTSSGEARAVILFLDDLDAGGWETLHLLSAVAAAVAERPVWLIGTCTGPPTPAEDPAGAPLPGAPWVKLERLSGEDLLSVGRAVSGPKEGPRLARFLALRSGGLPLAVVEWIHLLRDLDHLVPGADNRWQLRVSDQELAALTPENLDEVVAARMQLLPTSVRRLLTLAAVLGERFTAHLLQRVDEEHGAVVEACLEVMLERWLIRHRLGHWTAREREQDLALWSRGVRQGVFEFSHPAVRRVILATVSPERARILRERGQAVLADEEGAETAPHGFSKPHGES